MYELSFACDYSLVQMVEYRLRRLEIETLQRSFRASDVLWRVSGSRDSLDDFVTECDRVNIDIEVVEDME
jgi:putative IMPACT (imprinted ancient) family translation regulator